MTLVCFLGGACFYRPACLDRDPPCLIGQPFNDEIQWEQFLDERGREAARVVEMTAGGDVLLGGILDWAVNPYAWLAKAGPGGVAWSEPFRPGHIYVEKIQYLPDDNFLMATDDLYLYRMDLDGNVIWELDAGDENPINVEVNSIGFAVTAKDASGNVFLSKYSPDGELTWKTPYAGGLISGYRQDGTVVSVGGGGCQLYMSWLNQENQKILFGPYQVENCGSGVVDFARLLPTGAMALTWEEGLEGASGQKVIHIDADGELLWQKDVPGNWYVTSLAGLSDGTVLVAGSTCKTKERNNDVWVAAYDRQGDAVWERWFGGVDLESAHAIDADERGCIAVAAGRTPPGETAEEGKEWVFAFSANGAGCIP